MGADTSKSADRLAPTDPPLLLAGLIAAKRCGDHFLADVFRRELAERFGINVQFTAAPHADAARWEAPK